MRKIEKPTIKHKTIEQVVAKSIAKPAADSPYGLLDEVFPEAKGKLKYAYEADVLQDDYKPLGTYYTEDALGGRMYYRTNSRAKAQEICDLIFPPQGKYLVRVEMKAAVR